MVDEREWEWVVDHADVGCDHLVLATSVPVAMPGGLHDLEQWNERVCDGAWGRLFSRFGEAVRRAVDLEDWSAFHRSYVELIDFVRRVATPDGRRRPPATVDLLSGDVHFSFRARASFVDRADDVVESRIHQIVNSPIRNVLPTRERRVLRLGLSRVGEVVGRGLRRSVGSHRDSSRWSVEDGPFFANHLCLIEFSGRHARMVLERAEPDAEGRPTLTVVAESAL